MNQALGLKRRDSSGLSAALRILYPKGPDGNREGQAGKGQRTLQKGTSRNGGLFHVLPSFLHHLKSRFDALFDIRIGPAAADDIIHLADDLVCSRSGLLGQMSSDLHDHARLAVTALGNLFLDPRLFHRMFFGKPFNGRDLLSFDVVDGNRARSHRLAVDVDRTSPAFPDTAAVLCAREIQIVPERPKQRRIAGHIQLDKPFRSH